MRRTSSCPLPVMGGAARLLATGGASWDCRRDARPVPTYLVTDARHVDT
jgi:hypothetical protein